LHDLKARYIDLRQFVRFDRLMHGVLGIVGVCIWIDASTMPTPETLWARGACRASFDSSARS
jgi:hypothetical protein